MRALLLSPTSPWAGNFGAQQRSALMHDALAELMPVDVLLLKEGEENRAEPGDRPDILASLSWKQPPRTLYKYGSHEWVDEWCRSNIDWSTYTLSVGREFTPITKISWPDHLRTVVDCDDAFYRYTPASPGVIDRALARARGLARFWQTKAGIRNFDHAFFASARDQRLFRCRSSSVLPNVVRIPEHVPELPSLGAGNALIVGSMWYAPNRHGVEWFLKQCWPAISDRCPQLNLRIIGAAPPELRGSWERSARTEAPGFVDDLGAEYTAALFAIAPVHYGGGTCIKFLEAAAYRRPCVATDHVYRGFSTDFRDGYSTVLGTEAPTMVRQCIALYDNADRRVAIAERAHETVKHSYSVGRFKDTVQLAVRQLVGES